MKTYSLYQKPVVSGKAKKSAAIFVTHMVEPFQVETQEGLLTYGPDTCDDWGEGYMLSYPEDGSKPYAMSKNFFDNNYEYVK